MYQSLLSFDVITSFNSYRAFKYNSNPERINDKNKILIDDLETWISNNSKLFIWENHTVQSKSLIR